LQAAQHTKTALLGTVVTCPGLRHPAVHANTLQELQRLSGGRIFCGIGTGDLALIEMGEKPYKMADFVAYATAVRELTAGREIEWNGRPLRMRTEPVEPVPLWFGADGPRGIAEAGRVATASSSRKPAAPTSSAQQYSAPLPLQQMQGARSMISISGSCCASPRPSG
ncbi:MAG TPA: LLM class flavin-dependent oxidoreductase, partial [Terricaulis sp.]|nr:LLM class flavin-dependent oxidoreductase [Terricaulis sp.]